MRSWNKGGGNAGESRQRGNAEGIKAKGPVLYGKVYIEEKKKYIEGKDTR